METASLRILSPKTNMLRVGSTSKAWKMARVATGSTAEIREPNAKLWRKKKQYSKQKVTLLLTLFNQPVIPSFACSIKRLRWCYTRQFSMVISSSCQCCKMALKFKEMLRRTIYKKTSNTNVHVKSVRNMFYYMAKSVFAMRLVNLRSVISNADHNLKSKCSFHSSKSWYL